MKFCSLCILFLFLLSLHPIYGQVDYSNKSTEKIKKRPELEPEGEKKERRLLSIYIQDTQNVLYGNPCMDKVTQRFGYEYVVMPKNASKYHSGFERSMHNFLVKTALFFRNPFWKVISNKKAKECRQKTGDYMG
ncbi:hypothetical protein [Marivirga harenae]|uniref:hypothetical protein n=1 Tax=Marivirga harenae TaxID=2010992 RepID=UPI0026DEC0FD|nr:hypothetical protein [Marivirga harenae]WKV13964.1 hypothetical protein Q3Y49_08995 [Marivirga harenae]|tara:strand:+ start:287823 stop:288224 length:402 start_codon:yes stop_codon:yes gene_type:complete